MSDERIEFRHGGNGYIIKNGGKVYKKGVMVLKIT